MLEELAWTQQIPALAHLLVPDDIPRGHHCLPRPLTPEQDQLIQQELLRRNDFCSNVLLLIRHTGMRIGVPLGKLKTERWVPVDSLVCQLVERLRSMRSPEAPSTGRLLLSGSRGIYMLPRKLRNALRDVATAAGISARIVPHQMRHTYATEMLRAGVTLAAVVKLLGHKSPHMTLHYLEITQADLQREYRLARAHPRHLVPAPLAASPGSLDPKGILGSLQSAQHVIEMFRRTLPEGFSRRLLDRLTNRLTKIIAEIRKFDPSQK
jgi:hypothetical protein